MMKLTKGRFPQFCNRALKMTLVPLDAGSWNFEKKKLCLGGRAMAKVVSRRLLTSEAPVRPQDSPCGIRGG
jgi:hypothetical protein